MQILKLSVGQISNNQEITCFKCRRTLNKEGLVYFSIQTIDKEVRQFDYWCMEGWLIYHSDNEK